MLINGIYVRVTQTLLLLLFLTFAGYSQEKKGSPVRILFYNVENLFDINDDSLTADNDFLPQGVMRWTLSRYKRKISSLYKTIVAAGEWDPPAIAAFCEVENRKVLEDLVYNTGLSNHNYGIVHEDSPDPRGIDVCLIYRRDIVKVLDYEYWVPDRRATEKFTSRSVLCARCQIDGDTIFLVVNHWPSRRGGVLAGEGLRSEIAEMVGNKTDSLYRSQSRGAKIIIMGDFNATPHDMVIQSLPGSSNDEGSGDNDFLVNLAGKLSGEGKGTYRYLGAWEMIDQIIVSANLLKGRYGLVTSRDLFRIFSPEFLLRNDARYPGPSPFSTYRGYRYQGGYSDHLPVTLDLIRVAKGP
ncbi:MAG: endonuclease [Bacteroidales bacterium]|nr:endonuclease [Bacteroidales bacterium]